MAVFTNLFHLGEVLVARIEAALAEAGEPALPPGTISVGPPLDNPTVQTEQIRVSLLWCSPQATHRNDPWERATDGSLQPPPLSLSTAWLITTYGSTGTDEPVRAYQLLGMVLQGFHAQSRLVLPLSGLPGRGTGGLDVVLEPMNAEALDRVFSPLQLKHRPFALYEVGPVQLVSTAAAVPGGPVVQPGGARVAVQTQGTP